MLNPSRMVATRKRLRKIVAGSATAYTPEVQRALTERLTPLLEEGETLPDLGLLQNLLVRLVRNEEQAMISADKSNERELGGDLVMRRRRDELVDRLYDRLVEIRTTLSALFGPEEALELVQLTGRTSRNPELLILQAERVIDRLQAPDVRPVEIRVEGFQGDPAQWIAQVQPLLGDLNRTLEEVETERRSAVSTVREKQEALSGFDATVGGVVRILRGFLQLSGLDTEAERLRLRAARRGEPTAGETPPGAGEAT